MRILIAEDDELLASELMRTFRGLAWSSHWSARAADVAPLLRGGSFDVALLDLGLPDGDGLQALAAVRAAGLDVPVLLLTARDAVADRVRGLECGADDYLVKPFSVDELIARLKVLGRRLAARRHDELVYGRLMLDRRTHRLVLNGIPVPVSQREWLVLELLATEAERVVAKELLQRRLGNDDGDSSANAVEVHVCRLRAKLASASIGIRTVRGFGYMLETLPGAGR